MSGFAEKYAAIIRRLLPQPFTIAVILTLITIILAYFIPTTFKSNAAETDLSRLARIANYWQKGMWSKDLLAFEVQMMLMLVLGHVLALTKPVSKLINRILNSCTNTANSAFLVAVMTIMMAYFNWGLGLIFGAIFARKVAEHALKNNFQINYPLIGAAGYSGLMVWHGGLSGSAPLAVSQADHFLVESMGVISSSETIFSGMNFTVFLAVIIIVPISMYLIGRRVSPADVRLGNTIEFDVGSDLQELPAGAERLDHSRLFATLIGGLIMLTCFYLVFFKPDKISLSFLNLNFVNLFLFGCCLIFHAGFNRFVKAAEQAISGATGILIQFPLYFGIMGIVNDSGLIHTFSGFMVSISHIIPFEISTFISAAVVNVFVPSGGGQWVVQGPIIAAAAQTFDVSYSKSVMALAYGDQLTNMLQPFWALPLLGITGLKAKEILPYTLFLMLIGFIIYTAALLIF